MYFFHLLQSNIYPILILIMFFFSFYILKQNILLKNKISKLESEKKEDVNYIEKNKDTISIDKISKEFDVKKEVNMHNNSENNNIVNDKFNPDDYIKKEYNKKFNLEELSKKLDECLEPKTIELTEYEKKQEESAVISYKELLKLKDEIYPINEEDDTKYFIEELKKFRNSLNQLTNR